MYRKKVRMYQIGHTRTGSAVSPYVGIIQIRLRVRATQPTLSLLDASSPLYKNIVAQLLGICKINFPLLTASRSMRAIRGWLARGHGQKKLR